MNIRILMLFPVKFDLKSVAVHAVFMVYEIRLFVFSFN